MSYRINSTGRKRVARDDVRIKLVEQGGGLPPSFVADIRLDSSLKLAADARVYVEPYASTSSMRFDFGTVSAISHPGRCVLTDIDAGANVLFRLKVVSTATPAGKVLAAADGIRPTDDNGANLKPLLPLRTVDLGEQVWRLDLDKDDGPTLVLNNRIPEIKERIKADVLMQGAVYPEVVRQIARSVLSEGAGTDEETTEWVLNWKIWMRSALGRDIEDQLDDDSLAQLTEDLVESFATSNSFATRLATVVSNLAG